MMYDISERDGKLRTFPEYAPSDIKLDLELVDARTPMSLVISLSDRQRLQKLVSHKKCLISPDAKELIDTALVSSKKIARPLRPPTSYEKVAYVDERKELICIKNVDDVVSHTKNGDPVHLQLTSGERYAFRSRRMQYREPFTRTKMHYDEDSRSVSSKVHQMSLEGSDLALTFQDDRGWTLNFRDHPTLQTDLDESLLWEYFAEPDIPTLADETKDQFERALKVLKFMEVQGKFKFYPGQNEYIAQAACAESAQIAAETGVGKTLIAICLVLLKQCSRVLICAPKGTVKDGKTKAGEATSPSQWVKEFKKFAPTIPVHKIFGRKDHEKLLKENNGELPFGVFLTYDHVMFRNGFERLPNTWAGKKKDPEALYRKHLKQIKIPVPDLYTKQLDAEGNELLDANGNTLKHTRDNECYHMNIGHTQVIDIRDKGAPTGEKHAITCISEPCLATEIGHKFWDMVILDEAHLICNLDSQITNSIIKMQPKYKFALSATPIPNMVWNIFSLMGWLSVPNWYFGDRCNPRWPYKRDEIADFKREFVTNERDLTLEMIKRKNGGRGPTSLKHSPVISQPAKLLKLLRPTVAFISKAQCNPDLVKSNIMDIRVPMTYQQRENYTHYMNPGNVPCKDPKFRYGIQLSYLRGIAANPFDAEYNLHSKTNFNPKTVAILEIMYKHLAKGEQVIHVSARQGMTNELQERLAEGGVKYSRIDGTMSDHALEASKFKDGKTQVMLFSINCAQAYSFEQCKNLIVGSLEWSYGKFNQALGRVFRLNSPEDVNVYVVLHKNSIEELMFDKVGTKEDAATICLHGKRVPREVRSTDAMEVLAEHVTGWDKLEKGIESHEAEVLAQWAPLKERFLTITRTEELGITKHDQDAVSELLSEMEDLTI
jgi:SNF2 family DNA or RNA helicase